MDLSKPNVIPTKIFRETKAVSFYDATIDTTNGCDVVRHGPGAVSPPLDDKGNVQFYVHRHQVDNNLCVYGQREFHLIYDLWENPYHIVHLDEGSGSLTIPIGCYHRSISGPNGSVLINQSVRDDQFSFETEFVPASAGVNKSLNDIVTKCEPIHHWLRQDHQTVS